MGIKNLWNLLTPYCEKKPLFELNKKVIAIDLSGWVCESLNVVDYFVHPRFYLRNLFFRTCYLLQTGIIPVFVLEGTAPPLKYGVIIKRNQQQFRGARPKRTVNDDGRKHEKASVPREQKRDRFHHVLKQCEELLNSLGLVCVQAPGEAEALCAYLNRDNLVYGIVSQDSDCFAYGAIRVFRNFCASQNGGSVEVYDLDKIGRILDLGQEKVVAMGILTGCDYCPTGVPGVGREMINKFLECHRNKDILEIIKSWRNTANSLTESEIRVDDKNVCTDCGHNGKTAVHRRMGCQDCGTKNGCDESRWKHQRIIIKTGMDIKRKALLVPEFPHESIIDEFMVRPCELPTLDLEWKQPNLVKFIRCIADLLQWNEIYSLQKMLPLLTRWQIHMLSEKSTSSTSILLKPDYIKKKRSPKGVASYEIVWNHIDCCFAGLIPEEQIRSYLEEPGNTLESLWSTIEPQDSTKTAYPELVQSFESTKSKPKKTKVLKEHNERKKRATKSKTIKQKSLENFLTVFSKNLVDVQNCDNNSSADDDNDGADPLNDLSCLLTSINEDVDSRNCAIANSVNMSIDSIDLDTIALEQSGESDFMNLSEIVDRVCDPHYGEDIYSHEVAGVCRRYAKTDCNGEDVLDNDVVQQRLLLKQDVLTAATNGAIDQSVLNCSIRSRKRKSFFFEPLDIPPPELQEYCNEFDMFECTLMLKDQIIVQASDEMNQTIVYDVDF
ncbi:flap endonuclease GEN [Malaya genurostris]|uniref:flap endonuclease GEN n=1 Tax=Malaya genurostris TaxID=325434 RepID=UPI0026F3820C|nr:flap endonuclease GEN [Malaya genurostris]